MMRIAFDTSALIKRYIEEPGTARVLEFCAQASEVVVSVLCVPEMISALNRRRREAGLSFEEYAAVKRELAGDMEEVTVVPLTPAVISLAITVLENMDLRTLDAMHVVAALYSGCDLFVSADVRQCKTAAELGLKIERVG
ncbi:MAG: type II toxin-antitoxin system VapC family toxin [Planctomycetes bacterium]|nr:type II toxin-antitoxin system VapC family toxin [Planctomycetota bacterium]MBU4400320.1 type II toxin-antitoxin system VapC family toxin [Planctomycetota bacterium]MCG2682598.1 type II toxin-antitoxin system VapC family toxin [Planctomycetales bacterium]